MSNATEILLQKRATALFIAANPLALALTPVTRVKTGTGFSQTPGTPRPTQTFRLIDQSSVVVGNEPGRLRSSEGQERKITHQLLGTFDCEMAVMDFWLSPGARYEIDEILPDNGYERRAKVIRYGL